MHVCAPRVALNVGREPTGSAQWTPLCQLTTLNRSTPEPPKEHPGRSVGSGASLIPPPGAPCGSQLPAGPWPWLQADVCTGHPGPLGPPSQQHGPHRPLPSKPGSQHLRGRGLWPPCPNSCLPISQPAHALVGGFSVSLVTPHSPDWMPMRVIFLTLPLTPRDLAWHSLMRSWPSAWPSGPLHPFSRQDTPDIPHLPGAAALPCIPHEPPASQMLPSWPPSVQFLLKWRLPSQGQGGEGPLYFITAGPRPAPHTHHERGCWEQLQSLNAGPGDGSPS